MSTAAPDSSTLQLNAPGLGWLFTEFLLQHPNRSQEVASGARRVMTTSCEVTQGVFGLEAEGQEFVVVFDFKLTFSFLVKTEGYRHRFCSVEL